MFVLSIELLSCEMIMLGLKNNTVAAKVTSLLDSVAARF
jgi:hypothetical protein